MRTKIRENMRFGKLITIRRVDNIGKRVAWLCKCDCGNEVIVKACNLYRKDSPTTSCGCTYKNTFQDLTGNRYGKLTVLERVKTDKRGTMWKCKCDCGNTTIVSSMNLKRGNTSSCGCLIHEIPGGNTKHGMSGNRLYSIWASMKSRCNDINNHLYGGKGITVCNEWNNPEKFIEWSLNNGYRDGLSIDRINNDKGYYPENCRWVDATAQANNISRNVIIEYRGEYHTMAEWAKILKIDYKRLQRAIKSYGYSFEEAVKYAKNKEYS